MVFREELLAAAVTKLIWADKTMQCNTANEGDIRNSLLDTHLFDQFHHLTNTFPSLAARLRESTQAVF